MPGNANPGQTAIQLSDGLGRLALKACHLLMCIMRLTERKGGVPLQPAGMRSSDRADRILALEELLELHVIGEAKFLSDLKRISGVAGRDTNHQRHAGRTPVLSG